MLGRRDGSLTHFTICKLTSFQLANHYRSCINQPLYSGGGPISCIVELVVLAVTAASLHSCNVKEIFDTEADLWPGKLANQLEVKITAQYLRLQVVL
jgi:hypothetical protein